jgi:DNA-binding PadR family transcriptional regulator
MHLTYTAALVLEALDASRHHGFDIMDATGLPSGTVYPILRRLEAEEFATSRWEAAELAQRQQRPPRRYYELTPAGEALLATARARYHALSIARAPRRLKPRLT